MEVMMAQSVTQVLRAVVAINRSGEVVEFDGGAEAVFGYLAEEVLGQPMAACLIPPAAREAHNQGFGHFLASGKGRLLGHPITLELMRSDGSVFPAVLTMSAEEADDGSPIYRSTVAPAD